MVMSTIEQHCLLVFVSVRALTYQGFDSLSIAAPFQESHFERWETITILLPRLNYNRTGV